MIQRNRVAVVFVLLVLMLPVAGWSDLNQYDPNGHQLRSSEGTTDIGTQPSIPASHERIERARSTAVDTTVGLASFFDRFLDWVQLVVQDM